jgi:hypothetical protein
MLIFTEEIVEANPGLRVYLDTRLYLHGMDLDYEEDRTLEEFLKFLPRWLPCTFSEADFKKPVLKILKEIIVLPNNNPTLIDLKKIINNNDNYGTILNHVMMLLFDDYEGENFNMEESLETLDILFKLGAIPDQEDLKYLNKYKNHMNKIEKLFN